MAVAAVELRLCELHGQQVGVLDLLPVGIIFLLCKLLVIVQETVEHAWNLEKEHIEGGLHSNLYHEGIFRRVLSIKVSLVDGAGHLDIG